MAAPIIVVGRVLEVSEIGQPQRSSGDRRLKSQLTRIKIHLEEVVKGDIQSNAIEFYYFTYSPAASDVPLKPTYMPAVGQRRIYFLKLSNDSYRSVGDVIDCTLRVSSGNHTKGFCEGKSPGCCIAEILFIPQQDVDTSWFVGDLIQSAFAAEVLCSARTAQNLMQKLIQHPDRRISAS